MSQLAFTCSKLTIETLEKGVKYGQSCIYVTCYEVVTYVHMFKLCSPLTFF